VGDDLFTGGLSPDHRLRDAVHLQHVRGNGDLHGRRGRGFAAAVMMRRGYAKGAIRLVTIGIWCHTATRHALDCGKIVRHTLVRY
jgi:hypothetical protein